MKIPCIVAVRLAVAALATTVSIDLVGIVVGLPTAAAFSQPGAPVEQLDVYSPSMGRTIRVEFESGGPGSHAITSSTPWRRRRLQRLGPQHGGVRLVPGSGLSVVMPVGGMSSFYSDWYQPAVGNGQRTPTSGKRF